MRVQREEKALIPCAVAKTFHDRQQRGKPQAKAPELRGDRHGEDAKVGLLLNAKRGPDLAPAWPQRVRLAMRR